MKKIIAAAFATTAALALSACGSSDNAAEEAAADTVEMPADEALPADAATDAKMDAEAAAGAAEKAADDAKAAADDAKM